MGGKDMMALLITACLGTTGTLTLIAGKKKKK